MVPKLFPDTSADGTGFIMAGALLAGTHATVVFHSATIEKQSQKTLSCLLGAPLSREIGIWLTPFFGSEVDETSSADKGFLLGTFMLYLGPLWSRAVCAGACGCLFDVHLQHHRGGMWGSLAPSCM